MLEDSYWSYFTDRSGGQTDRQTYFYQNQSNMAPKSIAYRSEGIFRPITYKLDLHTEVNFIDFGGQTSLHSRNSHIK
jgi:hypothetical protein